MLFRTILTSLSLLTCLAATPDVVRAAPRDVTTSLAQGAVDDEAKPGPRLQGKINLNEATEDQLVLLPGIGPATAKKILDHRAKTKFGDPTHLMRIKGIGRKTYNNLKPFLAVEGPTTLQKLK